jgi:8-oxo-dGTP pyrophosphatase MutT (NUDIX family)
MVDTVARIALRLGAHQPRAPDAAGFARQAAVAAILREGRVETEVLLIKRASRPGDIWSGHMAFPGGHRDADDADLAATAIRETHEEIGLDLARHGRLLGAISPLDVNPIGTRYRMLVAPYVFALEGDLPPLRPNHEVAAIHWGSLAAMFEGRSATRREMPVSGGMHPFPGYRVDDEIVWGLTYQMLHRLFAVLDPAWSPPAA